MSELHERALSWVLSMVMMGLAVWAVRLLRDILWQSYEVYDRCDKAANKAEHIEMRAMKSTLRLHEVVRMLMQLVEEFDPSGSRSYLLRQFADLCTLFVEVRVKAYGNEENVREACLSVLRYVVRVAYDRFCMSDVQVEMIRMRRLSIFEAEYSEVQHASTCGPSAG